MKKQIDSSKIKILVCCHKQSELPPNPNGIFLPIQVGAAISDTDLGMQRDDMANGNVCDNISAKNKNYCELTAVYWSWKNLKKLYPGVEYIGLNHYRRYFNFGGDRIFRRKEFCFMPDETVNYSLNEKKLCSLLAKGFSIKAIEKIYPYSLAVDYSVAHLSKDLHIFEKIMHDLHPEYDLILKNYLYKNNKLSHYNMFILPVNIFDDYCEWLFGIFTEAEKRIDISDYDAVQGRIWGYVSERLLNVYLQKNDLKVKKLAVNVYNGKIESGFHYWLNRIRYNLGFHLTKRIY